MQRKPTDKIFVDVTTFMAVPRKTGIQKVFLDIVGASSAIVFLRFDSVSLSWQRVEALPDYQWVEEDSGSRKAKNHLVRLLRRTFTRISTLTFLKRNPQTFSWLRRVATAAYFRFFAPQRLSTTQVSAEKLEPKFVWLLDIPKSEAHLEFLAKQVADGNVKLGCYLYDLLPLVFEPLDNQPDKLLARESFLSYIELVNEAAIVLCASHNTKRQYLSFLEISSKSAHGLVEVAYPPVPANGPIPVPPTFSEPREGDTERTVLFAVAPLNRRKNLSVVFRAVDFLLNQDYPVELDLVVPMLANEDSDTRLALDELKRRYPKSVREYGPVSDRLLSELYEKSDAVVVPSLAEGFGLPIIEGISHNKHVIAARGSSMSELAEFLPIRSVDPLDFLQWVLAIQQVPNEAINSVPLEKYFSTPEEFRALMLSFQKQVQDGRPR